MRLFIFIFVFFSFTNLSAQKILLRSDRLFDGSEVHQNWALVVEGEKILEIGPASQIRTKVDTSLDFGDSTLMPGMIEGHSHVLLYPYDERFWNDQVLKESPSLRAIRGAKMAEKNLMAGFTTIRDLGSEGAGYADVAVKKSILMGINPGPRMLVAGPAIVVTGSYGPKGFHPEVEVPLGAEEGDGADLARIVRDQISKGADFIKVYADYYWGPKGEAIPTFSQDELNLIVQTANSAGRVVVAHATTEEGIRRAVLAGVISIEHGSGASEELLSLMKEKGVGLCPTLAATYSINRYRGWNPEKEAEPKDILEKRASFKKLLKSGVKIVAGGDVGVFPHGENALELELMADYGMKNQAVLESVTRVNAQVFGLEKLGELKPDFWADIIVVEGNPLEDIKQLYKVKWVMKAGQVYKD